MRFKTKMVLFIILTKTLKGLPKLLFSLTKLSQAHLFFNNNAFILSPVSKLKFMKFFLYGFIATLIFAGCTTKKNYLLGSWTMENLQPKQYEKLAVLVFSPNVNSRANVELAIADEFEKAEVKAMSTFSLFTMASNMKEIKAAGITDEQIQKAMKEKVESNNFDAILIISVLDTKQNERYVRGGGASVGISPASPYYSMGYPAYNYPYYGYYSYTVTSTSAPGYYEKSTDAFL